MSYFQNDACFYNGTDAETKEFNTFLGFNIFNMFVYEFYIIASIFLR